jgi:hypothetical protein
MLFLGACRWREMAALRWREYEPQYEGELGRIVFARSLTAELPCCENRRQRRMHRHPWAEMMGRAPKSDDLIVPHAPVLLPGRLPPIGRSRSTRLPLSRNTSLSPFTTFHRLAVQEASSTSSTIARNRSMPWKHRTRR